MCLHHVTTLWSASACYRLTDEARDRFADSQSRNRLRDRFSDRVTESESDSPIEWLRARSIIWLSDRERYRFSNRMTESEINSPIKWPIVGSWPRLSPTTFHMCALRDLGPAMHVHLCSVHRLLAESVWLCLIYVKGVAYHLWTLPACVKRLFCSMSYTVQVFGCVRAIW